MLNAVGSGVDDVGLQDPHGACVGFESYDCLVIVLCQGTQEAIGPDEQTIPMTKAGTRSGSSEQFGHEFCL